MKLWLISQEVNTGYDTYDSAVVVAADEEFARRVHPSPFHCWLDDKLHFKFADGSTSVEKFNSDWAAVDAVKVELVGDAAEGLEVGYVVCASFNAG